jgi:hypothetical protein
VHGLHRTGASGQGLLHQHVVDPGIDPARQRQHQRDGLAGAQAMRLGGEQPRELDELAGRVLHARWPREFGAAGQAHGPFGEQHGLSPWRAQRSARLFLVAPRRQAVGTDVAVAGHAPAQQRRERRADADLHVHLVA